MKIRGVLFDKDGTLLDHDRTWTPVCREMAMDAAGGDAVEAARLLEVAGYREETGTFASGSVWAAGNNLDLADAWFPELSREERRARAARFDAHVSEVAESAAVPLTDLHAVLGKLRERELLLGIGTNDTKESALGFVRAIGLEDFFTLVVGYDSVEHPKPCGDMVEVFCAHAGLDPAEVAVVGDSAHDLEMAANGGAGLKVAVLSGTGTREDLEPLADVVLESVDDLPDHLASLNGTEAA